MNPEVLSALLTSQLLALELATEFHTPDSRRSSRFVLSERSAIRLTIQTQGGASIRLPIEAFIRTVVYLHNNTTEETPALIGSSNDTPFGLCTVARGQNGRTRIINYVLPILEFLGWVQTDGNRPNTAWLNASIAKLAADPQ